MTKHMITEENLMVQHKYHAITDPHCGDNGEGMGWWDGWNPLAQKMSSIMLMVWEKTSNSGSGKNKG